MRGLVASVSMLIVASAASTVRADGSFQDLSPTQRRLLSGAATLELNPDDPGNQGHPPSTYFPRGSRECPNNIGSNVKVNQDCLNLTDPDLAGRGQAQNETAIAQDPANPNHLIAAANDYRGGDLRCFISYSLDKGRTWNDVWVPDLFTRGATFGAAREYWQVCEDPSVAGFDTKGNAYFVAQVLNRGNPTSANRDRSSGVYAWRSTLNNGASWNFPGRPVVEVNATAGAFLPIEDKPYSTVDANVGSPFQDRVYVTWTEFSPDGSAIVWASYSSDYGEHFSPRHLVSIGSPTLCTINYGVPTTVTTCNLNRYAQPFVGPNGTLYVVYGNINNTVKGNDNRNQILISISYDGGNTFVGPQKVADFYDLPDCATYQSGKGFGTTCVPEKGPTANSYFRAVNYPAGAANPTNGAQLVVTFGSYINPHSNEANGCIPAGVSPLTGQNLYTGVKTPGACNNDILVSVSNDGGLTFTGTATDPRLLTPATQDPGQAATDQWFQWIAFTKTGKLAVSYYDRQYDTDETTGYSDVSLSGSGDTVHFNINRVTSSSMPPPTQFAGTFWGDYSGLSAVDNAYPLWSDTRNPELFVCRDAVGNVTTPPSVCTGDAQNATVANDQDIYVSAMPVPSR